jgi:chemotaxis protein methyltransferase CheR
MKISAASEESFITEQEFAKFCDFFYKKTGMMFDSKKKYFVERRIAERISSTASASFNEYFSMVRFELGGKELQQLVNLMTVNETYFYREDHQFHCLSHGILPELTAKRRRGERIRIWSLPCSTGEEPYSIAIHLLEHWDRVDDFDIEIIASDIDTNVLRAAEAGIYEARSLQRLSRELVARYFMPVGQDRFKLIDPIRQSVSFTKVNATDAAAMRAYDRLDVIFCRNMLIYFDDQSRLQAAESFYDNLIDGGFICLGHSESMSRISPLFTVRTFPQAIVYQKQNRGGPT